MIPQRPVGVDPQVRALAEQVAALSRQVRELATSPQLADSSVEDGSLEVYDDDEVLRTRVGKNPDGSYGIQHGLGPAPAVPTEPDVIPVSGGVVVVWDGHFEDPQPDDVQRVAVHVGETRDFTIVTDDDEDDDTDSTELAAIYSPRGGSAYLALDPGQWYYIRLTAIAHGGAESAPTDVVPVWATQPEAAYWQDEFVLGAAGAQDLTLTWEPIELSEHLYWNGLYQQEDEAWTRLGNVVSLTDTPTPPRVGDRVTVEYAYLPEPEDLNVPYGSAWRTLVTTEFDGPGGARTTPEYDDSAWPMVTFPVGKNDANPANVDPAWVYPPVTSIEFNQSLWVRRTLDVPTTLHLRLDGNVYVYVDGVQVAFLPGQSAGSPIDERPNAGFDGPMGTPVPLVVGPGVLAMFMVREVRAGYDGHYYDIELEA